MAKVKYSKYKNNNQQERYLSELLLLTLSVLARTLRHYADKPFTCNTNLHERRYVRL